MFEALYLFGRRHSDLFPEGSLGRGLLIQIESGLAELKELTPSQLTDIRRAQTETGTKTRARKVLRSDLRRILKTARFIAGTVPGFDEPFKLPRSEGDAALLYTARAFAERAAPCVDVFIKYSMPAGFIEDLNTNIRIIERSVDDRSTSRNRHKAATAAIDAAMKKCMKAALDLYVIMANILRHDKLTRLEWDRARHVQRARRKKAVSATTEPADESSDTTTSDQ